MEGFNYKGNFNAEIEALDAWRERLSGKIEALNSSYADFSTKGVIDKHSAEMSEEVAQLFGKINAAKEEAFALSKSLFTSASATLADPYKLG